jgi:hypothetical protein
MCVSCSEKFPTADNKCDQKKHSYNYVIKMNNNFVSNYNFIIINA